MFRLSLALLTGSLLIACGQTVAFETALYDLINGPGQLEGTASLSVVRVFGTNGGLN